MVVQRSTIIGLVLIAGCGAEPFSGVEPAITGVWKPITEEGVPPGPRPSDVLVNGKVAIWGNTLPCKFDLPCQDGASYDVTHDLWTPIGSIGAPHKRYLHVAVGTGTQMIVWGGVCVDEDLNHTLCEDGAVYDLQTKAWEPMASAGAPSPRELATAVWTGTQMLVWGGQDWTAEQKIDTVFANGARYDPAADTWSAISAVGAPSPRMWSTTLWTGSRMIVWGGANGTGLNDGAIYDPESDQWAPMSNVGAPSPRKEATAVWTGTEMLIWGGDCGHTEYDRSECGDEGGRYDPSSNRWTAMTPVNAPRARVGHSAVWSGKEMLVWGGWCDEHWNCPSIGSGASYDPAVDRWTPIHAKSSPPSRGGQIAYWLGDAMLVWGGWEGEFRAFDGAIYKPLP